ncbi:hypothetical protein [Nocardioides lianchengensis]|uniref:Uncharacterized protein n=1 Tax=Nocardioides lianchengensis TaxID=1045774 RepID=A0A1G6M8H2_9ACTN|nr:hypothetical protein [Nocardioides lianchengensis]NYG12324.1 hypothetical protein [Nocardioides lianchengensis]SDC51647.1 hypothetical protein SAMN05421872_102479 [Nocardioides lianchengensis]
MSSAAPRRRAERPARERQQRREGRERKPLRQRAATVGESRLPVSVWAVVVLAGVGCLVAAMVPVGPEELAGAGSVAVAGAFAWALAARTGGRPILFGVLAVACGIGVLVADEDALRTGAAVMTCVISAVLGVVATVPARRFVGAARECVVAILIAAVGALATAGFAPTIDLLRFEYVTLVLALAGAFGVVYRLGAGFHGLGRRGVATVLIGAVVLAVTLAYAELLRRYGTPGLVDNLLDGVRWSREHLGAFPRPIETVLGVPALVWGTHMRARRRQGWWVCAFGAAATTPVANSLMNPTISLSEVGLSVTYGLVIGLVIGYVVVRLDLLLTGPRGRRARQAEEEAAARPEPARTSALL